MPTPLTTRPGAPKASVGEPITARKWNILSTTVDSLAGVALRGQQARAPVANVLQVRLFSFVAFPVGKLDYIECEFASGGDVLAINVAKPFGLRPSLASHDGVSFSYSTDIARTAGGSEAQVIVPGWDVGDPVIAIGPINTGVIDADGKRVLWYDSNLAWNRGWAADV